MKILLFSFIIVISSCYSKLGLIQQPIAPKTFNTQGFYYNKRTFESYFLYLNGTVLSLGNEMAKVYTAAEQADYWSERMKTNKSHYKKSRGYWGLINVDGNQFKMRVRIGEDGIGKTSGVILNNTTLLITKGYKGVGDTLYFQYLPVKPDSTTLSIK
jgi:hypothetical protein